MCADNQYHDLFDTENSYLLVNIQASKLHFKDVIDNELSNILKTIHQLDLSKYRFINVSKQNINCFYKGYKTKKTCSQDSDIYNLSILSY